MDPARGDDLLIVAGGVGLAPLRPVLLGALARRADYRRVILIAGARAPAEFLFRGQLSDWAARPGLAVELTIDRAAAGWDGTVGFVTEPLQRLALDVDKPQRSEDCVPQTVHSPAPSTLEPTYRGIRLYPA
jgi:NAD(P)H-flavin reductase